MTIHTETLCIDMTTYINTCILGYANMHSIDIDSIDSFIHISIQYRYMKI